MTRTCTVLVVEDDPHISDLIAFLLQDAGYDIALANTAAQARARIDDHDIDLVILDWMLPDMPGVALCREIKSRREKSFLPILMLTARSNLADRVAGLDAGADDFLTKPFHSDELMARARALLRIRAAELDRLHMIDELRIAYDKLATTQSQLVQTSRLASLGELVAGVAHELNNPLGIILGNAELLPVLADPDDRRAVTQIIEGAQRARRIVQSLVTFARQGKMEEDWYRPRDLVERVLDLKRADLRNRGISLDVDYEPNLPMLWADGAQIQQVLLNLLLNAEYALRGRENARIALRIVRHRAPVGPPALVGEPPSELNGNGARLVVIDVMDNGVGIDSENQARLFQPFFTTKPVGQGTGLGLAISYGIVAQHGGTLQVHSVPGVGCSFRIALPITREGAVPAPLPVEQRLHHEAGSILVIDDEPYILDFVSRLLTRNGWDVQIAQQAQHALELFSQKNYDVVLCDVRMPGMDGSSFYMQLQQLRSTRPPHMIMMTGDTSSPQTGEFLRQTELPVLHKPFTSQELLRALATPPVSST